MRFRRKRSTPKPEAPAAVEAAPETPAAAPPEHTYAIGATTLVLPPDHALPRYRALYRLYDENLVVLASALRASRGSCTVIDIGANVGDSAAFFNAEGPASVLCIEGDPAYLPFLTRNAERLGEHVHVEHCFVGLADGHADPEAIARHDGTSRAVEAVGASQGIPVRTLDGLCAKLPQFARPDLIKLDTDGMDFELVVGAETWLAARQPVVHIEYYFESADADTTRAARCREALQRAGYVDFLVFDNFGNLLLRTADLGAFEQLDAYILSNLRFGTAVYYLDVVAFPAEAQDVADAVQARMTALRTGKCRPLSEPARFHSTG